MAWSAIETAFQTIIVDILQSPLVRAARSLVILDLPIIGARIMSFFGFDSALPERRDGPPHQQQQRGRFATDNDTAFALPGAGEEEDLAVYTWGEGMGGTLLEGGDELNDETFGNLGDLGECLRLCSLPCNP